MVCYVGIGLENCEILYRCEMLLLTCIIYGKSAVLVALVPLSCRLQWRQIIKGVTTCAVKFSVISNSRPGLNGSARKESSCSAGDLGSIPGLGRSPGEGKGFPLQYSGLEKSMDYIVHGVAKSWTRLNLKIHLDEQSEVNQLISDSSEKRESLYFIVLLRSSKDYFVVTRYKG